MYDKIACDFSTIGEALNNGVAWRQFRQSLEQVQNRSDFVLYCLGTISRTDGTIQINLFDHPQEVSVADTTIVEGI